MTAATETGFVWTDAYVMGFGPMDNTHEEFVHCVNAVLQASDDNMLAAMQELARHTEEHFAAEDEWMTSTEFPARECHMNEHAAVLRSVHEVLDLVEKQGRYDIARDLAGELAKWFPGHTDYLDSALSHWMCKQAMGGKPVVLRRDIQSGRIDELLSQE